MKLQRYIFKDVDGDESEYYECDEVDPRIQELEQRLAKAEQALAAIIKHINHSAPTMAKFSMTYNIAQQYFNDKVE